MREEVGARQCVAEPDDGTKGADAFGALRVRRVAPFDFDDPVVVAVAGKGPPLLVDKAIRRDLGREKHASAAADRQTDRQTPEK